METLREQKQIRDWTENEKLGVSEGSGGGRGERGESKRVGSEGGRYSRLAGCWHWENQLGRWEKKNNLNWNDIKFENI